MEGTVVGRCFQELYLGKETKHCVCSVIYITNDQVGISEETVFLRQESPYLLKHIMPSSGSCDKFSQVTSHHTPPLPGGAGLGSYFNVFQ